MSVLNIFHVDSLKRYCVQLSGFIRKLTQNLQYPSSVQITKCLFDDQDKYAFIVSPAYLGMRHLIKSMNTIQREITNVDQRTQENRNQTELV